MTVKAMRNACRCTVSQGVQACVQQKGLRNEFDHGSQPLDTPGKKDSPHMTTHSKTGSGEKGEL